MQSIITKFVPATDYRGSRIRAFCERGSIIIGYAHALSSEAAHEAAAKALVDQFTEEDAVLRDQPDRKGNPWSRPMLQGALPKNKLGWKYCFVITPPTAL